MQHAFALVRKAEKPELPLNVIAAQPTMSAAIKLCVQASGLEHKEIYMALGLQQAQWSKTLNGDYHFDPEKLHDLMNVCGNEAPLVWLAHKRGYALVLLKSKVEKALEDAEKALEKEREKTLMLTELLKAK